MRKIILTICLIILVSGVNAQKLGNLKLSLFTGVNYALPMGDGIGELRDDLEEKYDNVNIEGLDLNSDVGVYGRFGFHFGLGLDYYLKDNLAIIYGLSYSQKGFIISDNYNSEQYIENPYVDSDGVDQVFITNLNNYSRVKIDIELDYLDLPIGLKYQADNGFNIFGGVLFALLVNQNVNFKHEWEEQTLVQENMGWNPTGYSVVTQSDAVSESDNYDNTIDDDDPHPTLTGFQVGAGYNIGLFNVAFKISRTSKFGDVLGYGIDNRNLTFQLSTGIIF